MTRAWGFVVLWVSLLSVQSFAVLPPESFGLIPTVGDMPIDPQLRKWLDSYSNQTDLISLNRQDFHKQLTAKLNEDPIGMAMMKLRYERKRRKKSAINKDRIAKQVLDGKLDVEKHHLGPYLIYELLQDQNMQQPYRTGLRHLLGDLGGSSCPAKLSLLEQIDSLPKKGLKKPKSVRKYIEKIESFHSFRFRKKALDGLLQAVHQSQRQPMAAELAEATQHMDALHRRHTWIHDEPSDDIYQKTARFLGRRHCTSAKSALLKELRSTRPVPQFRKTEPVLDKIGRCYRKRSRSQRLSFWRGVAKPLQQAYGFKGYAHAKLKEATLLWGRDDFVRSRQMFKDILAKAGSKNDAEVTAQSLFALGRLEENHGAFGTAIDYYSRFVDQYPGHEDVSDALKSLVILEDEREEQGRALAYAKRLVESQTTRGIDDRESPVLSFALFWSGRLSYELHENQQAEHYWQRGASEFYSTFYGALSHYLLEKIRGKKYFLQPIRSPQFAFDQLRKNFTVKDQMTIERTLQLLSLGLDSSANCEIDELDNDPDNSSRIYTISLLRRAADSWLASIKLYGKLPRSFRHTLPIGSERLLFPKAFSSLIGKHTASLKLDADLVYAIIRQESVFNPRALSPAGARGLMQLMPATARLESKRIKKSYLPAKDRRALKRDAKRKKRLFVPEVNIALGVHHVHSLLKKFDNPLFILTAYNASPRATRRWQQNIKLKDRLAFIESIPYAETKSYVKLVMRNYFYYKRWYRSNTNELPYLDMLLPEHLRKIDAFARVGYKGKSLR